MCQACDEMSNFPKVKHMLFSHKNVVRVLRNPFFPHLEDMFQHRSFQEAAVSGQVNENLSWHYLEILF